MDGGRRESDGGADAAGSPDAAMIADSRITPLSVRFRDALTEERFQHTNLQQTRYVLAGLALLGMFGAAVSGYGTYLSFGPDSWVFRHGLLLRAPLLVLGMITALAVLRCRIPARLYAWNATGLALGCATIALRMTVPPPEEAGIAALFHVSRDGLGLLLLVAMAEVLLIPGWFAVNAGIVALALAGFLVQIHFDPARPENPLNLSLAAFVALVFILGMGGAVQHLRRQTFLVHARLREANARLERLARTDPLTGCANRRHFFELGEAELERSRRYRQPLSVLAMDIDHFKSVNDRHGHAVGDRMLEAVVAAVEGELRDECVLGRIGGEEFAVLLPMTDAAAAVAVAERLRQRVAAIAVAGEGGAVRVTASFGAADNSREAPDFDSLVIRADTALYQAKDAGRDRVIALRDTS